MSRLPSKLLSILTCFQVSVATSSIIILQNSNAISSMKPFLLLLKDFNSLMFPKETALIAIIFYFIWICFPLSTVNSLRAGSMSFQVCGGFVFLREFFKDINCLCYTRGHQKFCYDCTFNLVRGPTAGKGIRHLY